MMKGVINMTKKHYISIADAIKDNLTYKRLKNPRSSNYKPLIDLDGLIGSLCYVFKEDNNLFNTTKFIEYLTSDDTYFKNENI